MVATYATYTILMKEHLTGTTAFLLANVDNKVVAASTIFSTLTVFDILRIQFMNISTFSTRAIQGSFMLSSQASHCIFRILSRQSIAR